MIVPWVCLTVIDVGLRHARTQCPDNHIAQPNSLTNEYEGKSPSENYIQRCIQLGATLKEASIGFTARFIHTKYTYYFIFFYTTRKLLLLLPTYIRPKESSIKSPIP